MSRVALAPAFLSHLPPETRASPPAWTSQMLRVLIYFCFQAFGRSQSLPGAENLLNKPVEKQHTDTVVNFLIRIACQVRSPRWFRIHFIIQPFLFKWIKKIYWSKRRLKKKKREDQNVWEFLEIYKYFKIIRVSKMKSSKKSTNIQILTQLSQWQLGLWSAPEVTLLRTPTGGFILTALPAISVFFSVYYSLFNRELLEIQSSPLWYQAGLFWRIRKRCPPWVRNISQKPNLASVFIDNAKNEATVWMIWTMRQKLLTDASPSVLRWKPVAIDTSFPSALTRWTTAPTSLALPGSCCPAAALTWWRPPSGPTCGPAPSSSSSGLTSC